MGCVFKDLGNNEWQGKKQTTNKKTTKKQKRLEYDSLNDTKTKPNQKPPT